MALINFNRDPDKRVIRRRTPGKRPSFEERERREASALLKQRMKDNPYLEMAFMNKWLGLDAKPPDPIQERKNIQQQLLDRQKQQMLEQGIEDLKDDPDFNEIRKELVLSMLSADLKPGRGGGRIPRYSDADEFPDERYPQDFDPTDPTEIMARANQLEDMVEERRARHGGGGILQSLNSPEVVGLIANVFSKFFMPQGAPPQQIQGAQNQQYLPQPGPAQPMFIVETEDGKVFRMTEEEFRAHRAAKARASVPAPATPAPAAPTTEVSSFAGAVTPPAPPPVAQEVPPEQPQKEESLQEGIMSQVIKQLIPQFQPLYEEVLEASQASATQYFPYFLRQASSGVGVYPVIYNYLMDHSYEDLLKAVTPYRNDPELRPYIETLEKKASWIIELFSLVQDREEELDPDTGGIR